MVAQSGALSCRWLRKGLPSPARAMARSERQWCHLALSGLNSINRKVTFPPPKGNKLKRPGRWWGGTWALLGPSHETRPLRHRAMPAATGFRSIRSETAAGQPPSTVTAARVSRRCPIPLDLGLGDTGQVPPLRAVASGTPCHKPARGLDGATGNQKAISTLSLSKRSFLQAAQPRRCFLCPDFH